MLGVDADVTGGTLRTGRRAGQDATKPESLDFVGPPSRRRTAPQTLPDPPEPPVTDPLCPSPSVRLR